MHSLSFLTLATALLTAAASSTPLGRRCSPVPDPDLPRGYRPPAPCWQTFDTACQPHILPGTEMTVDTKHKLAVVYGVSESCVAEIVEELRREAAGTKNYGWVRSEGWLTVLEEPTSESGGRVLVVSGMGPSAVQRYAGLLG